MKIALTSDLEQWIQDQVDSGSYPSVSDVLENAVSLLREHDRARQSRLEDLRQHVAVGIAQLERGESMPFDEACLQRIEHRGRATLQARKTKTQKAKTRRANTPV